MTSLPIDVINVICGWTTQEDVDWYPQFDVKTEKLKWKVNITTHRTLIRKTHGIKS